MSNDRTSVIAQLQRTVNQSILESHKADFRRLTTFGSQFLHLLERSGAGVWRVERDGERRDRWWLHMTLSDSQSDMFGLELEVLTLYTEYTHVEPRTLETIQRRLQNHRVEPGFAILVSQDKKVIDLASRRRGELAVIPIAAHELELDSRDLRARIAEHIATTDHFDLTIPVQSADGFFGRSAELSTIHRALDAGQSIGLFGLRKAGKTSLMNTIELARRERGSLVAKFEMSEVLSSEEFRYRILTTIRSAVAGASVRIPNLRSLNSQGNPSQDTHAIEIHWINDLHKLLEAAPGRVELFIDEVDQAFPSSRSALGSAAERVFASLTQLRRFIQDRSNSEFGITLFCAGVDPKLFESPLVFDRDNLLYKLVRLIWLAPMSRDEMAHMVRSLGRRMGVRAREHEAIDLLFEEYGGHPLLTRRACSRATRDRHAENLPFNLTVQRVATAVAERGRGSTREEAADLVTAFAQWFPEEADVLALLLGNDPEDLALAAMIIEQGDRSIDHAVAYGLCDRSGRLLISALRA